MKAYKENLSKDSVQLLAIKQCRKRLAARGIDLSTYNTIESAADINDLRLALQIDSLNLRRYILQRRIDVDGCKKSHSTTG